VTTRILGAPVTIGATREDVVREVADAVVDFSTLARVYSFVISGGASTTAVLGLVAQHWRVSHSLNIIVSDERHCDDPAAYNAEQLRAALAGTPLASAAIIAPPSGGDLISAAREWSRQLEQVAVPSLAIVSMASDGHIASLFPDVETAPVSASVVVCHASPKPPPQRISLSSAYLRGIEHRFAIVVGTEKSAVLSRVVRGADLPVARLAPTRWFVESSAMIS
jgi:6-phosphogluconolactonase